MSQPALTKPQKQLMFLLFWRPMHMLKYLKWAKKKGIEHRLDFVGDMMKLNLVEADNLRGNGVQFRLAKKKPGK